jgi:hypothetical protein
MGWLVALPTLALLYLFNKKVNPKGGGKVRDAVAVVTLLLAFGAGCGFAYTLLGTVVFDVMFDRVANLPAQMAAIILPTVLLVVIGGGLGETGGKAVETTKVQLSTMWAQAGQ